MRTMRLSSVGTAMLALLFGLSGAALTQDEKDTTGPSTPVAFSAHMRMDASIEPYSLEFLDDHVAYRDQLERWTVSETSDPRFSGVMMVVASVSTYRDGVAPTTVTTSYGSRLRVGGHAWC